MTTSPTAVEMPPGDALAAVQRDVAALRKSAADRENLRETVGALSKKFPVTLQRELGLDEIDDNALDEIISDAQDILLHKLIGSP
jgi:hypothetical protein